MAAATPNLRVSSIDFEGKPYVIDEGNYPYKDIEYHCLTLEVTEKTVKPQCTAMYRVVPRVFQKAPPDKLLSGDFLNWEVGRGLVDWGYRDIWYTVPLKYIM